MGIVGSVKEFVSAPARLKEASAEISNLKEEFARQSQKIEEFKSFGDLIVSPMGDLTLQQHPYGSGDTVREAKKLSRVPLEELEMMYYRDPVCFNGVNFYMKALMTKFHLVGPNERTNRECEEWMSRHNIRELMPFIGQHACIYGDAYLELIDQPGKDLHVELVDPKTMDVERDPATNAPLLDSKGFIKGYVQKIGGRIIKIRPEQIAQFNIFRIGDSLTGIGLIEPMYGVTRSKLNVEAGVGNVVFKRGFPLHVAKVGNEHRPPSPEDIRKAGEQIANINNRQAVAVPWWIDIQVVESKGIEKLREVLEYFIQAQVAGFGQPHALIMGSGSDTNRATLDVQAIFSEHTLRNFQQTIDRQFVERVLSRFCEARGLPDCPSIERDHITTQNLNEKAARLQQYVASGLLTPDEKVERLIREVESLPDFDRKVSRERPAPTEKDGAKEPEKPPRRASRRDEAA
jgi:hypothetical protein